MKGYFLLLLFYCYYSSVIVVNISDIVLGVYNINNCNHYVTPPVTINAGLVYELIDRFGTSDHYSV